MNTRPLTGITVLVTRGKDQAKEFSEKLSKLGAVPLETPLISFSLPETIEPAKQAIKEIHKYDWLIFTSKNGVDFFFQLLEEPIKMEDLPKIAVVGKKTAKALERIGIEPALVPEKFVAEGLIEELKPLVAPYERVLLVKGNLARPILKQSLEEIGACVTDAVVYETKLNSEGKQETIDLLIKGKIDVITFTSPSTVQGFMKILEGLDWHQLLKHSVIACIGPITKQAAEREGLQVQICPENYTIDDMIEAIVNYFAQMEHKEEL